MKFSIKTWILVGLLVAAIGYTIYNWIIGGIDAETAILCVLVLRFPDGQNAECSAADLEKFCRVKSGIYQESQIDNF